jgi:HEAT repeat protein
LYDVCDEDPRAAKYFARALKDTDYWIRWRAAKGLRRMGESAKPAVLELARALTHDADPRVRLVCAQALEAIGKPAIVAHPSLIEALSDEQLYVRQAASEAMAAISPGTR